MLKVWGRNTSSNVQKAMWAVGELGLAHERVDIGGKFGGNKEPAYLAMNPNAKVPVVEEADNGVGLHLHDTRGTALVNAYAALQYGVRRFDTSIGGLGGSPFAEGAAGNLATEELVYLLDGLGYEAGIDLERLLQTSDLVSELIGHPVASRLAGAGPPSRRAG